MSETPLTYIDRRQLIDKLVLDRAAEFLKEDYVKTRQHLSQLQQGSQELTDSQKLKGCVIG